MINSHCKNAFTLIELLIVVSILMILSGVASKVSSTMQKTILRIQQHVDFYQQGDLLLERIVNDYRESERTQIEPGSLLTFIQRDRLGQTLTVRYLHENADIIREVTGPTGNVSSLKITTDEKNQLHVTQESEHTITIEWKQPSSNTPLNVKPKQLMRVLIIESVTP